MITKHQQELFMKQGDNALYLVESFYSFQGEGKYAGRPSVFLRFGGCNLNCAGFGVSVVKDGVNIIGCDSIRATNATHFKESWKKITNTQELIQECNMHLKNLSFKPDIVITGGEPLINHDNLLFISMIKHFLALDFSITIETNATFLIDFVKYPFYKDITFAMSVKLENSGEPLSKRVKHKAIQAIASNATKSFFKFVLDGETHEIESIVNDINLPIYCMPMGSTARELSKHDKAVAEFCIKKGYNYVDRLHIRLWDNEEKK